MIALFALPIGRHHSLCHLPNALRNFTCPAQISSNLVTPFISEQIHFDLNLVPCSVPSGNQKTAVYLWVWGKAQVVGDGGARE